MEDRNILWPKASMWLESTAAIIVARENLAAASNSDTSSLLNQAFDMSRSIQLLDGVRKAERRQAKSLEASRLLAASGGIVGQ